MSNCNNCNTNIIPLKHQLNTCKFLINPKNRGLIIFHSVGSGKTITSLLTAYCLLKKHPNKKIIITAPVSILQNYKKEMKYMGIDFGESIVILSYTSFVNYLKLNKKTCDDSIFIIDEAHNFGNSGVRTNALLKCAHKAFKVILLTATPVKNNPSELKYLYSMITKINTDKSSRMLTKALHNKLLFEEMMKCKISYFKNEDTTHYPGSKVHIVNIKMTPEYYSEYYNIQENIIPEPVPEIFKFTKNLEKFYNGIRRGVNKISIPSPKIKWVINKIQKDVTDNKKVLVYSNWMPAGINIIEQFLIDNKIPYSNINGSISKSQRDYDVSLYNKGISKVILITSAGGEGLDLKGTRTVIITEPHWNNTRIQQVIGRAIRYKSHDSLPKSKRFVDIYHLILVKPTKKFRTDKKDITADMILQKMSVAKQFEISKLYDKIKEVSIEVDTECS